MKNTFLFIFYVCAYLSTEVKPIYHFINLTLNSPTPPGVLSQKSTNYFFTHDDTIILCFHMIYWFLEFEFSRLDYLNQISILCYYNQVTHIWKGQNNANPLNNNIHSTEDLKCCAALQNFLNGTDFITLRFKIPYEILAHKKTYMRVLMHIENI